MSTTPAMKVEETRDEVIVTLTPAGVPASDPDAASVIWLHGLGADGHDFVPIIPELRLAPPAVMRFIFPHAPVRPITLNNGMPMRAWYDIRELSAAGRQDEAGTRASAARIDTLIDRETARGVATARIILAGFSQGGAIALHAALRYPQPLGGVMALSTYLPLHESVASEASAANRNLPILMCHGLHDPMLSLALGEKSRDFLVSLGYAIEWKPYPMQHEVCRSEIGDIAAWLTARLARSKAA
ncbi:MAG TPA: alpha/beta hydrolase-fold protein [Steroidobacteraceae bacterium]|nr:alpha/beta hydrolase-fold protein [Steroidobacteraceae bacterium]HQX48240.1 alpha/beta hydrolase-fold protein [Steroidobacteraceae bacterium]HQX78608.1 alpha/beta hydrolase-fold protein [Steroidobacteraceae bacterium]HQZ80461.1 alpha/beta hydrolase-fold protein [Steroidobacteraceae bacterium]